MAKKSTVFQALDRAISGNWGSGDGVSPHVNSYDLSDFGSKVLYRTGNKEDYETKKLELQQEKYLKERWLKANVNLSVSAYSNLNRIQIMYRDVDFMDASPEIGAALDLVSEESVLPFPDGQVVSVYSSSERVKKILEDLFVNRLNLQLTGQMVIRAMCKYGNQFMLLDIDKRCGVKGWRQLPVMFMERIENGIRNPYGGAALQSDGNNVDLSTQFVWTDENSSTQTPFRDWQVAHFRILANSIYLPYGCLVGDTRIETEQGFTEMSSISIGDKVWTFNVDTQERELSEVTMFMPKGVKDVYGVRTLHNYIEGTEDHKLLTYSDGSFSYKEIKDLSIGDLLVVYQHGEVGRECVESVEYVGEKETYDFTVGNENSNFFANGIVTHNCSYLNSARRYWRMMSLMEDTMLLYRLERSIERRVYKIFVGAIDDADVGAYVEQIANEFKRTPIVDPQTGQIDLRKNILPVHKDTPIPLLDGRTITIEELAKEYEAGKDNYVYSVQDDTLKIVPGRVAWCGKNYTAEKLLKITLDDGSHMIIAPEHEVMMRDGSKKRADLLTEGDSLMPCGTLSDKVIGQPVADNISKSVSSIEWVGGDDVYCMTVVGPQGSDDRHNFALRTWNEDKSWSESGVFVSNCQDQDIFIPVRDQNAPTPIDTLPAAQNMTALDDIKYVQNKVCTALRIPRSFLNFEEAAGDGKNLALQDIRFTRTINRIQQAFLMELTKVAMIHLYLLGFDDELTNFTLSMSNPSTQAEQLEIENMQKKIDAVRDAVSDPGNGLPVMSQTRALKQILKWSEKDIKENFEEIRLEKGIAAELEKTAQIIKKTGIFDTIDRIYGEPGAEYADDQQGGGEGGMDGGMGGGGPMGGGPTDFGGELDGLDNVGADQGGDIAGEEGSMPTGDMAAAEGGPEPTQETYRKIGKLLTESAGDSFDKYIKMISERKDRKNETVFKRADVHDKDELFVNEEFDKMIGALETYINETKES